MKKLLGKLGMLFVPLLSITPVLATNGLVYGCTDKNASNYNSFANIDDSTCEYVIETEAMRAKTSNEEKSLFKTALKLGLMFLPIFIGVAIIKNVINGKK